MNIPEGKVFPMHRFVLGLLFFLPVISLQTGCGPITALAPRADSDDASKPAVERPNVTRPSSDKPMPDLQLPVPTARPAQLDGKDLTTMDEGELLGRANEAMAKADYSRAASYQYWHVQKSHTGQYNLACFLARIGQTDAALYWLQQAALEEGVDTQHAVNDEDLHSLQQDPRWPMVHQYLVACATYYATTPLARTLLVLPKGYQKVMPIPAILWLHGRGSRPEDFINSSCQVYADQLNVALIGVSGTTTRGPRTFVWTENPVMDAERLQKALAEVSNRVTIQKGHVITFGFSQGAQVGLEVAVRDPETYAGAIVLSPGAQPHLDEVERSPLLARRGFVLSCGAKEHPGNVQLTAADADWLRQAKAHVIHKTYPGVSAHSFPEDFDERFPEWVHFILKARHE